MGEAREQPRASSGNGRRPRWRHTVARRHRERQSPCWPLQLPPEVAALAPFDIPISALRLKGAGSAEPWHCLRGSLTIGGCLFEVVAIAIGQGYGAEGAELRKLLARLRQAFLVEGPFTFNEVQLAASDGREHGYAIFIYPEDCFA